MYICLNAKKKTKTKMKIFYLILLIFSITKTLNSDYNCERLNKAIDVYPILFNKFNMVSLNLKNFNQFSELTITCSNKTSTRINIYIQINPNNRLILDDSLNLTSLEVYKNHLYIYISNLNGIELHSDPQFGIAYDPIFGFITYLDFSKFKIYNNKSVFSQQDCLIYEFRKNYFTPMDELYLGAKLDYEKQICPFIFNNSKLNHLSVSSIQNSFIFKRLFEFLEIESEHAGKSINTNNFQTLTIGISYSSLTTKIVNKYVFKEMKNLDIKGYIYNIQYDLFKYFDKLVEIRLSLNKLKELHHNGNDWMHYLCYNKKSHQLKDTKKPLKYNLLIVFDSYYASKQLIGRYVYPDEDFCLFSHFPHDKLVLPKIYVDEKMNCSCTILFLIQFSHLYLDLSSNSSHISYYYTYSDINGMAKTSLLYCLFWSNYSKLVQACDFERRIRNCNRTEFNHTDDKNPGFDLSNFMDFQVLIVFFEYLFLIVLTPLCALIGILANAMVIFVVYKIKDLKKSKPNDSNNNKEKMFKLILVHSAFNIVYCVVMMLRLLNECPAESLFCSALYTTKAAQRFRIVFIEFFGNLIKTCCNVSYLAISISRLALTQNKPSKCLKRVISIKIAFFLIALVTVSCLFSLFKLFDYEVDDFSFKIDRPHYFPTESFNFYSCFYLKFRFADFAACNWIDVAKILNNIVNDVLIFVLCIILDVVLVVGVSRVIDNKKSMVKNVAGNEEDKKKKKITKMVIINNAIFTVSHLPEFLTTSLMVVFNENLYFLCIREFECDNISRISQFFIFISIMSQFSVNNKFNKVFNESLKLIMKRKFAKK